MYIGKVKYGDNTWPVGSTLYGTCDTAANTAAKVVTMPNFDTLLEGVTIHVKFTYSNGAHVGAATLNVNNTGAKTIMRYGTTAAGIGASASWNAGAVVSFTYDGTYWLMNDWMNTDSNTTYSAGYGLTLMSTTFSLGHRWAPITKGLTYSRIMYAESSNGLVGCSGILTVLCTRGNVVVNSTFFITTSHDKVGLIIQISSNSYSPTILRLVVNSSGAFYVDIKDTVRDIPTGNTLTWYCAYIPISSLEVTTYTNFTDGTSIPSGFLASGEITTTVGDSTAAIKNITRSGTTFTATRLNGTTFTFDQLDNNTTYTLSTGDSNGLIKVTPSSGSAYNVSVKGLGDRAFDSTSYLPLTGGKLERLASKISDLNNTSGSDNAWNKVENSILYLKSQNNAMAITIGKTTNERVALILVGHSDYQNYANIYGILHLNKFGGDVYINNSKAWHAGNDGSGSGLDADLLDGYHESAFGYNKTASNYDANEVGTHFAAYRFSGSPSNAFSSAAYGNMLVIGAGSDTMTQLGGPYNSLELYFRNGVWNANGTGSIRTTSWNKIWHDGNDGSGSGLDADTVDGKHASDFALSTHNHDGRYVQDYGSSITVALYDIPTKCIFSGHNITDGPTTGWISGLVLGSNWNNNHYLHYLVESGSRWYATRSYTDNKMNNWNQFAYVTDNVASATKLLTARTIWGQSFNGTDNVSGGIFNASYLDFTNVSSSANHGGCIYFHHNGSSTYTSRIIEWTSGKLSVEGTNLLVNGYPVFHSNHVLLSNGEDIVDDYGIGIVGCHGKLPANIVSDFANNNSNYNTPVGITPYAWGQVLNFFYDNNNAHFLLYVSDVSSKIDMNSRNSGIFYRSGWASSGSQYYSRRPWRLILDNASILTYYGLMLDQTSTHSILKMAYPKTSNFYNVLQYGGANAGSADLIVGSDNKDTHIQGRDVYIDAGTYYNCLFVNNSSGYVGIGTTSPSYKLHVNGLCGATAHLVTSDIRLKDIQKYLSVSIEDIANAPLFLFKWKNSEDQKEYIGTSAQYWDEKLPELVSKSDDTVGTLALLYDVLGALSGITLAKEILQLKEEIKQLQALIAELKLLQK